MLTLCIRYTLDAAKLADFEAYARAVVGPIERCGGKVVGYFAPTKFAGPTNRRWRSAPRSPGSSSSNTVQRLA
jgi:hypothetical protein